MIKVLFVCLGNIATDDNNIEDIQSIVGVDTDNKIYRLLDFANTPRNIKDPWYTGNFDETYRDRFFLNTLDINIVTNKC